MRPTLRFATLVAALSPVTAPPVGAQDATPFGMDAMEVMADLALIDGACRNVVVNLGVGFRFAASHGVPATAILPGGSRRTAFEAVLQARRASFADDELCGQIARNYMEALPTSVVPITNGVGERP